jgi:hypothetical protein
LPALLRTAARPHGDLLRAIAHGDETAALAAALASNDYPTDLTFAALCRSESRACCPGGRMSEEGR